MSSDSTLASKSFPLTYLLFNSSWKWFGSDINRTQTKNISSSNGLVLQTRLISSEIPNSRFSFDLSVSTKFVVEPSNPVYVRKSDGDEEIVYRVKLMKINQIYPITWKSRKIALRRTDKGTVEILERE